ncbi:glycosyltransferase family 2 protein [uncultured Tateyamaria sp.]|uniref:glycosyltransferase family 2 protein n=1 Tax=uncultured Tateyamaria sp. TaxID=455651 RepID=UPI002609F59A|nr:glycosyltransferase family 2 protein [uncultured Tateyamaria sp.]
MSHLAILCVRNEAAFLLEWLAHHRAVGFDHFLVFSNDCDDGTDAMLDHLAQQDWLTHVRNDGPYDQGGIQFTAMKQAAKMDVVRDADWILPLDVDEFVNIHVGDGTLADLHATLPDATAITLTWRLFGNNGQVRFQDVPVTQTFARAAPEILFWPWRASMFKTLYANDGTYRKPGVHRPRSPDHDRLDNARWYDSNGRPLDDQFKTKRIFSNYGRPNFGLAQINHYPLGAMESYVLKADRGRAVHSDDLLGVDYWVERNFSTDADDTIRRYDAARDALLTEMRADQDLVALHDAAVAWRSARFDALMEQEPFRALFGRLLMTPPTRPVPQKAAQFMIRYANKARQSAQ